MNICEECKHCVGDVCDREMNGDCVYAFVCDEGMGNFMTDEGCWRFEKRNADSVSV